MSSKGVTDSERQASIDVVSSNTRKIRRLVEIVLIIPPIILMVVGGIYLLQCSAGNWVSVFLFVAGLMGLLNPVLCRLKSRKDSEGVGEQMEYDAIIYRYLTLINCLILCWLLISLYWIYSAYEPKDDTLCKVYLIAVGIGVPIYIVAVSFLTIYLCSCAVCCFIMQGIE